MANTNFKKQNIQNNVLENLLPIIEIPKFVENLQLPDPNLINFYKQLKDRIVWIEEDVSEESMIGLIKQILIWNKEDVNIPVEERQPIKVLIYTYGGDLRATLAAIDIMLGSITPVFTYNCGVAYSAGLFLLLAGSKRFGLKRSSALIHSGSGGTGGTFEQTKAQMDSYEKLIDIVRDFLIERTNIDKALFKKYSAKEWYLFGEDQLKLGIIHEEMTKLDSI